MKYRKNMGIERKNEREKKEENKNNNEQNVM